MCIIIPYASRTLTTLLPPTNPTQKIEIIRTITLILISIFFSRSVPLSSLLVSKAKNGCEEIKKTSELLDIRRIRSKYFQYNCYSIKNWYKCHQKCHQNHKLKWKSHHDSILLLMNIIWQTESFRTKWKCIEFFSNKQIAKYDAQKSHSIFLRAKMKYMRKEYRSQTSLLVSNLFSSAVFYILFSCWNHFLFIFDQNTYTFAFWIHSIFVWFFPLLNDWNFWELINIHFSCDFNRK